MIWAVTFLAAAAAGGPARDPQEIGIQHKDPPFRLTVPAGYAPLPQLPANAAYGWRRLVSPDSGVAVTIEILPGALGREDIQKNPEAFRAAAAKSLPPGSRIRLLREKWGEFEIDVMESRFETGGIEVFALSAQVPLAPTAILVAVAGPAPHESQVRGDLKSILGGLKGRSNWLTPRQRVLAFGTGAPAVVATLLFLSYGIVHLFLFRGRPERITGLRVAWLGVVVTGFIASGVMNWFYEESKNPGANSGFGLSAWIRLGLAGWAVVVASNLVRNRKLAPPDGTPSAS